MTAYSVSTDPAVIPRSVESSPTIITVRPRRPFGLDQTSQYGDTSSVRRIAGLTDASILPLVVDGTQGTGDTYRLTFSGTPANAWSVFNVTKGRSVLTQVPLQFGETWPLPEGGVSLHIAVDQPFGLRGWDGIWSGPRPFTKTNGDQLALESYSGAAGWEAPVHLFGLASERPVQPHLLKSIQIRIVAHDTTASGFRTASDDTASYAYRFVADADLPPAQPSFSPWITTPDTGWAFQDYRISVPMAAYSIDVNPPQRLAIGYVENNVAAGLLDGYYWPELYFRLEGIGNTSATGPREWLFILDAPYTGPTPNGAWKNVLHDSTIPVMYMFTWNRSNTYPWSSASSTSLIAYRGVSDADTIEFTIAAPATGSDAVKASLNRIGVYPNPYMGERLQATRSRPQFVTFTNLPERAVIQVFNLAGHLVRTLRKEGPSQFLDWDLLNEYGIYVGSGMYICRVELPDLNSVRVLKLGVVMSTEEPR